MQPDPQPEFIVFRVAPELLADDPSWRKYHGRWEVRALMPPMPPNRVAEHPTYTATATGRFEFRADGATAEVFEIRPPEGSDVSDQARKVGAFEVARQALIDRYGTADPDRLRQHGRADETELGAADSSGCDTGSSSTYSQHR